MVAKSYQNLEVLTEPYIVKNRKYVKVRTATGTEKQVRWYEDYEYKKLYPEDFKAPRENVKTQKEVLGFDQDGFITIFKGDTYPLKDWFKENGARYTKFWGWSFGSFAAMPSELPEGVTPLQLQWDAVGNEDGSLKVDSQVQAAVEELLCDDSVSTFIGNIGDKVEIELFIKKVIPLDGYYGVSMMHIMEDENENVFVWTTTARTLNVNTWYKVKGSIKDHRIYNHIKQTILTRCKAEEI